MKGATLTGTTATRFSPVRLAIYEKLLDPSTAEWTVATLTDSLPAHIRRDSVRSTLYVLLAYDLMNQVRGHSALTVRLTPHGAAVLRPLVDAWRAR